MEKWHLAEAKNKFSELIDNDKPNFKEYLLYPPRAIQTLEFTRDKTPLRTVL
jgi:hypothetical protein